MERLTVTYHRIQHKGYVPFWAKVDSEWFFLSEKLTSEGWNKCWRPWSRVTVMEAPPEWMPGTKEIDRLSLIVFNIPEMREVKTWNALTINP